MMDTVEILKKARELISDESRWAQNAPARDTEGRYAPIHSGKAVSFCSIGAICKVMGIEEMSVTGREATETLRSVVPNNFGGSITGFNDTKSHADVLDLFDCAIAAARGVAQ